MTREVVDKILLTKRWKPLFLGLFLVGFLFLITQLIKMFGYHIIYSPTPSMPSGFYLVVPAKNISRHDIVEFTPPDRATKMLQANRWLPKDWTLIKYVLAVPGDHVCVKNKAIWVNGRLIAKIFTYFDNNKPLPKFNICGRIGANQYLLIGTASPRSFDSRYFGLISAEQIIGRALPIFLYKK